MTITADDAAAKYQRLGWAFAPKLIGDDLSAVLTTCLNIADNEGLLSTDWASPNCRGSVAIDAFDASMIELNDRISLICGRPLVPSYSFARICETNAELVAHTDRDACQVSVSIVIRKSRARWPFQLTDASGRSHTIDADVGDAIIFRGTELTHWRPPLAEGPVYLALLHYVTRDPELLKYGFATGESKLHAFLKRANRTRGAEVDRGG